MQNLEVDSTPDNWIKIKNAIENELFNSEPTLIHNVLLSCEEIFVNVCSYAYKKKQERFILKLTRSMVK